MSDMILTLFGEEFLPDPNANSGKNKGKKKQDKKKDVEAPATITDALIPTPEEAPTAIPPAADSATVPTADSPSDHAAPAPQESLDTLVAASIAEQLFQAAFENMLSEDALEEELASPGLEADTEPIPLIDEVATTTNNNNTQTEEAYIEPIHHAMGAEAIFAQEMVAAATQPTIDSPTPQADTVPTTVAELEAADTVSTSDDFVPVATHEPQEIIEEVVASTEAPVATVAHTTAAEPSSPEKAKPIKGSRKIPADEIGLPDNWDGNKQYYTIGEVADLFKVNTSHIRFWTNEFKLKVRTNRKGDRLYTPDQIREIKTIHHLVKVRGYTLAGAKAKLKSNGKLEHDAVNLKEALTSLRDKLLTIRNQLY